MKSGLRSFGMKTTYIIYLPLIILFSLKMLRIWRIMYHIYNVLNIFEAVLKHSREMSLKIYSWTKSSYLREKKVSETSEEAHTHHMHMYSASYEQWILTEYNTLEYCTLYVQWTSVSISFFQDIVYSLWCKFRNFMASSKSCVKWQFRFHYKPEDLRSSNDIDKDTLFF